MKGMVIVVVKLHETYERGRTYGQYCKDCGKVTRQKYRGTYNQNKEDMFVCQNCGSENFEDREVKESKSLKESSNYKIMTLSMDVAVKGGDKIKGTHAGSADRGLWTDIAKVLRSHGYRMAGDFIDVDEGDTEMYQDNGDEFFEDDD